MSYYSEIEYVPEEEEDLRCASCQRPKPIDHYWWIYLATESMFESTGFVWLCSPSCCITWCKATYEIPVASAKCPMID